MYIRNFMRDLNSDYYQYKKAQERRERIKREKEQRERIESIRKKLNGIIEERKMRH